MKIFATGPDFGFESENRTILPGQWYLRGQADVKDVLRYAKRPQHILHNGWKYVTVDEMKCMAGKGWSRQANAYLTSPSLTQYSVED